MPASAASSLSSADSISPASTSKYAYSSEPIDSTTSTLVRNFMRSGCSSCSTAASSKCSGPDADDHVLRSLTALALQARAQLSGSGASPNGSLIVSPSSRPGRKFIDGEPMKPATNRLCGSS